MVGLVIFQPLVCVKGEVFFICCSIVLNQFSLYSGDENGNISTLGLCKRRSFLICYSIVINKFSLYSGGETRNISTLGLRKRKRSCPLCRVAKSHLKVHFSQSHRKFNKSGVEVCYE